MKKTITLILLMLSIVVKAQITPEIFNENINTNDIFPQSIEYYNGEIIIPDLDNDRILKTSATVINAPVTVLVSNTKFVTGIKVIGSELFFFQAITTNDPSTNTGKLSKINLSQSNPTVIDIMSGLNIPSAIDGNTSEIYFSEIIGTFPDNDFDNFIYSHHQISKINLVGTPTKTVLFQNRDFVDDLKLNSNDLYWSEYFENSNEGKIFKYTITNPTPTVIDFYTFNNNEYAIRFLIHNNKMYYPTDTGTDIIKVIDLSQNPLISTQFSNTFNYNASFANPNAMIVHNNEMFVSTSFYIDNNNQKEMLYKLDISNLLNESFIENKPTFYPNPTTSQINFSEEISELEVYDVTGKKVKSFENANTTFNIDSLENGIYVLKGKTSSQNIFTEKLVKQ